MSLGLCICSYLMLIIVMFPSTQQYKMSNTINRCSDCFFFNGMHPVVLIQMFYIIRQNSLGHMYHRHKVASVCEELCMNVVALGFRRSCDIVLLEQCESP
jgi:hypothetical protein